MRSGLNTEVVVANSVTAAVLTTHSTGLTVDLSNYNAAVFLVTTGTITDGTWTPEAQESDTDVSTAFTAITATDLDGSFAAFTASRTAGTVTEVGYKGSKRYVRLYVTSAAATTGGLISGQVLKGDPRTKPS